MNIWQGLRFILYTILLVVFLRHCTPLFAQDTPTIRIEASPRVQFAGFKVVSVLIRVTIPRNDQNRAVCVSVEGPLSRVSCYDHRGSEAPFRQEFRYAGLSAGEYVAVGELQWLDAQKGERKLSYSRDTFVITSGLSGEQ